MSERGGAALRRVTRTSEPAPTVSPRLQPVRPRARLPRGARRGSRGAPSPGPRRGAAFRQWDWRWRCFRDCAWRPKRRRTRRCGIRRPGPRSGRSQAARSGGGAGPWREAPCPELHGAAPPGRESRPRARSSPATSRGSAAPSFRGLLAPPAPGRAAAPKCAIGRARRRCLLPPPRSHGDPRQPMQWTLGPCGTPGAATAPAPLHYKYFSKMRRSSQRAPRPPAASAPRP